MLAIGETVTDGLKTYVLGRDHKYHYISSGGHANHHVSTETLEEMVKQ